MPWYENLGWSKNPFDSSLPAPRFMCYDSLALNLADKSKSGKMVWLYGSAGIGKTTILRWIGGTKKLRLACVYWHPGESDVEYLKKRVRMMKLKAKLSSKKPVILIDEADHLGQPEFLYLLGLLDDYKFHPGIIFTAVKRYNKKLKESVFRNRILELMEMESAETNALFEMVKQRISDAGGNGIDPFNERKIFGIIDANLTPREILQELEKLAEELAYVPEDMREGLL